MRPSVSVVMGVHDDADWLDETIDSVLAQTFRDFEFIIVDDGSTDSRIGEILGACQQRDPRIRLIGKRNEGLTAALIDGCNAAEGEFICRIDVGDTMARQRLERQRRVLEGHRDCAFVSSCTEIHGPAWEPLWVNKGRCGSDRPLDILPANADEPLKDDVTHHGSVMFRRSDYVAAGGYRSEFYYGQDWDLWYRLAERGTFFLVREVLYHARVLPHGIRMRNVERHRAVAECSLGAIRSRPWGLRAYARLVQSLVLCKHRRRKLL